MSHHVVIAGGGIGALETLLALQFRARDQVSISVVTATRSLTYRALSVAALLAKDGAIDLAHAPEAVRNYLCLLGWSPKDRRGSSSNRRRPNPTHSTHPTHSTDTTHSTTCPSPFAAVNVTGIELSDFGELSEFGELCESCELCQFALKRRCFSR